MKKIHVHAINLAVRTDRKAHIRQQFEGKDEFELAVVPAIEHPFGAYGLYQTVRQIVQIEQERQSDYFLLCEDDHLFTNEYNIELLKNCIQQAHYFDADILSGGVSWFDNGIQVQDNLFWINKFNGMQFTLFFKKFYNVFIETDFSDHPVVDVNISEIAKNKFMIYPYISLQKEFGYSDVTSKNAEEGYVDSIFTASVNRFQTLSKVRDFYTNTK